MEITREKIGQLDCVLVQHPTMIEPEAIVVLCHGFGAPGQDLVPIAAELVQTRPEAAKALFVFPAAPLELDPDFDGRAWWMIDVERLQYLMAIGQTREMRNANPPELKECREMLTGLIEQLKVRWRLPSSRMIVGGFSQGSMLTTEVALHYPERLGGLIVWSGALICEEDWKAAATKQQPLNVIQTHGRHDIILSHAGALDLKTMLDQAGHHVKFRDFNGPHTIPLEGIELAADLIADCLAETQPA
jgi:phospholipase/carboxylesterase